MSKLLYPPVITGIRSALFIQPHPDDNEIGAGGTMARLVSNGCKVYCLTVTDGRLGGENTKFSEEEVASVRRKEAIEAMKTIGAENAGFLEYWDQTDATIDEIAESIRCVIEKIKPDSIFTVDPELRNEWHSDHIKVGRATNLAVQLAKHKVSSIAYYFTDIPNTNFNITDYYNIKIQAINCHKSQLTEEFFGFLKEYFYEISKDSEFDQTEKLKIISLIHTHCWTLKLNELSY